MIAAVALPALEGVSWSSLGAMAAFAFGATWTPGPNNMMLASSGATFGFKRTVPHALGVALGFPLMFFLIALGFEAVLLYAESRLAAIHPIFARLREGLVIVAALVMVWFGLRIALSGRAKPEAPGVAAGRPFSFLEAAAFQWINPKAWVMTIAAASLFFPGAAPLTKAAIGTAIFVIAGLTSAHSWAAFGAALRRVLSTGARLQVFNACMGALVIASVALLFAD